MHLFCVVLTEPDSPGEVRVGLCVCVLGVMWFLVDQTDAAQHASGLLSETA